MKVLVTGASGFVGSMACARLAEDAHEVVACIRSRVEQPGIFYVRSPELGPEADLSESLADVDAVLPSPGWLTSPRKDPMPRRTKNTCA
jgi:nucleoside-diphosphate-sugar epimerase